MTDRSFQKLQEELQVESNPSEWTMQEVGKWLDTIRLGEHAKAFAEHRITGDLLHSLSEPHLIEMGVTLVGQRIVLMREAHRIRRHTVNKTRFEVLWESDAQMYTNGVGDWLYKQCCCEPCLEQPDHYKLTASSLSLTGKEKRVGCCQAKARRTRNIDLSNVAGVSEYHRQACWDLGCAADWIYIELHGDKLLDPVEPLAVKCGDGGDIAQKIQMAMEEAQEVAVSGHVDNSQMVRA